MGSAGSRALSWRRSSHSGRTGIGGRGLIGAGLVMAILRLPQAGSAACVLATLMQAVQAETGSPHIENMLFIQCIAELRNVPCYFAAGRSTIGLSVDTKKRAKIGSRVEAAMSVASEAELPRPRSN